MGWNLQVNQEFSAASFPCPPRDLPLGFLQVEKVPRSRPEPLTGPMIKLGFPSPWNLPRPVLHPTLVHQLFQGLLTWPVHQFTPKSLLKKASWNDALQSSRPCSLPSPNVVSAAGVLAPDRHEVNCAHAPWLLPYLLRLCKPKLIVQKMRRKKTGLRHNRIKTSANIYRDPLRCSVWLCLVETDALFGKQRVSFVRHVYVLY